MFKFKFEDLITDVGNNGHSDHFRITPDPTLKGIVDVVFSQPNFEPGPWIAGGAARQLVLGETEFNDIDIWFSCQRQLDLIRARLSEVYGSRVWMEHSSDNAETFDVGGFKVQLIKKKFFNSIDEVFDGFDFTCCQLAMDRNLQIYGPGKQDAVDRRLRVHRLNKDSFLARYAKYVGYGYSMPNEEFLDWINKTHDINYKFDGAAFGY
jgi:hypothetical protein